MATDAYEFLKERQDRLAAALASNEDVANFVQSVLEHAVDRAESRGEALSAVEIESPQIVKEGNSFYIMAAVR